MSPMGRMMVAVTLLCSSAMLAGAEDVSGPAVVTFLLMALVAGLLPLRSET